MAEIGAGIKNTDTEIRDGVWADSTKANGADIAAIKSEVDAILDLTVYEATITPTDASENIVYQNDAPSAVFYPRTCMIDLSNMQAGDTVVIRTYYRIKDGGSPIKNDEETYSDAQSIPLKTISLNPNRRGIKITLAQTAGTYRSFDTTTFYYG